MRRRISSRRVPVRGVGRPAVHLVAALVIGLLVAAALTACTADRDGEARPAPAASSEASTSDVPALDLRVEVTRVSGRLHAARRATVAAGVRRVLGAYVRAAYLDPDGPVVGANATLSRRDDGAAGGGAFVGFTPDAARQATHDRSMLTSAGFGDVDEVEPLQATAFVSVLAPKGRLVGATARTTLRFAVTGADGTTRQRQVQGRVLLTPHGAGWRIFGYELAAGPAAKQAR